MGNEVFWDIIQEGLRDSGTYFLMTLPEEVGIIESKR
jgi:hypothetical protein